MSKRTNRATWLLFELMAQRRWITEHGGSEAGYVAHYGSVADPDHYGSGGEAIYAADQQALQLLQARYERAARHQRAGGKRCNSCGGQLRPAERIDGPAAAGECTCWMTVQAPPDHGHRPASTAIEAALSVLVLDPRTREYLKAHDPKALQQAAKALHDAGLQYQVPDVADNESGDLCWYCFAVLAPGRVCQDCTAHGRQLPADVWR